MTLYTCTECGLDAVDIYGVCHGCHPEEEIRKVLEGDEDPPKPR